MSRHPHASQIYKSTQSCLMSYTTQSLLQPCNERDSEVLKWSSPHVTEIYSHAKSLYIATWSLSHSVDHRPSSLGARVRTEGDAFLLPSSGEFQVHTQ